MSKPTAFRNYPRHPAPANKQAANVMKKGEHWDVDVSGKDTACLEQDNPYPVIPERLIGSLNYYSMPNLTGIQRGRLTAYGFNQPSRKWACRCSCGRHVLRRTRAIANDKNLSDACLACRELMFLKREEHYRRTGKDTNIEDFV
ncbi:hypothetical protein EU642_21825 [Salmonella enterica]|nr:hypothetical protein [Salmonella enterica]EAO0118493.1 hypothetical protein [Salmonella enterica]EAO3601713.1 hypothetical protein [Salmonella enterica]EAR6391610.1 hypothetical protein [Salmonella enterica]EAV1285255.1 hypothetical protein [Salmonella enterica]